MAIPTSIQDLSPTDELNSPAGTDAVGGNIDNFFRAHAGIIRRALSAGSDIASAATVNLPPEGTYFYITGTATINTITGGHPGRVVLLHLADNAKLANNANIITGTGNTIISNGNHIFVMVNVSSNVWRVVSVEADIRSILVGVNSGIATLNTVYNNLIGRSILAGSGLTGGGTLSDTRTISLGTPGTITNSTTNSVSSTSHTHSLSLPNASTTTQGIVELATDAETVSGSDSTRAVTPSGLNSLLTNAPTVQNLAGGNISTKGVWTKVGTSYGSHFSNKNWQRVKAIFAHRILNVTGSGDNTVFRIARYNSTGASRLASGKEYTIFTQPNQESNGVINIEEIFTGLSTSTTYRYYLEVYVGGVVGTAAVNGGNFILEAY